MTVRKQFKGILRLSDWEYTIPPTFASSSLIECPLAEVLFNSHGEEIFFVTDYGVIQAIRTMMSCEDANLLSA
jgi:hypothetical protein